MPTKVLVRNKFGAQTVFALRHTGEICGSNGLPLTPKSIGILGRSQILKILKHNNLSSYLDFIRGKHERLLIVVQWYDRNISMAEDNDHVKIAYETLSGLAYLNRYGLVHRILTPENILLDENGNVKLFNYGLYHVTDGGKDVEFPIGSVKYTAPEVLLSSSNPDYVSGPKVDVWSLGIIMTELVFKKPLWPKFKLSQCLRKVLSLIYCDNVLERLARESDCLQIYQEMDPCLRDFIQSCLQIDCRKRPTPEHLLKHELFKDTKNNSVDEFYNLENSKHYNHPLDGWDLQELYHLWRLAGGDAHSELKRNGFIKSKPPILSMPNLILLEGMTFGHVKDSASMLDLKVIPLPLDALLTRLQHISVDAYYPLIETRSHLIDNFLNVEKSSENFPLVIRERDTEHQFHRIVLYKRLLQGYPYSAAQLCSEASKDIPPFFRGEIWAALLDVKGDLESQYIAVDKETSIPTDRQIEVDIPRCHQYNELLSSKTGHSKLKRILKAWVVSNHQYVYWQGLDSLCAPFLYLNFNNEARAYACFSAFIPKYLNNFFLKDNSAVIKEYLTKFSHLIAFHDPVLANHLHDIAFVPELFAIPWFLTMFSHVFPLHKIFHLWDRLLLGDASYPLFVGLAILQQLRDTLLSSGFNECILLFSDLPDVDIQKCVQDSSKLFEDSPKSISLRKYQRNSNYDPSFIITDEVLKEIQTEFNPRINATDLLMVLNSNRSSLIIIDARTNSEFADKAIRGSINIPYESIDFSKNNICDGISPGPELSILMENRNKMIVVVGNKPAETAKICRYLTAAEFSKVCSLHGSIESLRRSGLLAPSMT